MITNIRPTQILLTGVPAVDTLLGEAGAHMDKAVELYIAALEAHANGASALVQFQRTIIEQNAALLCQQQAALTMAALTHKQAQIGAQAVFDLTKDLEPLTKPALNQGVVV